MLRRATIANGEADGVDEAESIAWVTSRFPKRRRLQTRYDENNDAFSTHRPTPELHDEFLRIGRKDDGDAAIRTLRVSDFDVVVSDVNVANGNGTDLLREVRALGRGTPVILITGRPSAEMAKQADDVRVFRYVLKAVAPSMLRELVEMAALASDRARAAAASTAPVRIAGDAGSLRALFESSELTRR